jgi:hypothetical protein
MHSSYSLESAPIYGAYSTLIEPTPGLVNIRMTWTEVSEQQSALESRIQHANYSIPDHLALPGVVLLLILIFHNGRTLLKAWHVALRNQYQISQMTARSRRVETLERIFHQDSSRR